MIEENASLAVVRNEEMFFFAGPTGRLLGFWHGSPEPRQAWLLLPPFAEERQVSHAICVQAARALASEGHAVLRFDLSGTADSEGEWEDATWEHWLADAECAFREMRRRAPSARPVLWGLRTGAALALDLYRRSMTAQGPKENLNDPAIAGLMLWQPVLDTQLFLQQFLRQKWASSLASGGVGADPSKGGSGNVSSTAAPTVKSLIGALQSGETVEVMGYPLRDGLASSLAAGKKRALPVDAGFRMGITCFGTDELPVALAMAIQSAQSAGAHVEAEALAAEPFWDRYWQFRSDAAVASVKRFSAKLDADASIPTSASVESPSPSRMPEGFATRVSPAVGEGESPVRFPVESDLSLNGERDPRFLYGIWHEPSQAKYPDSIVVMMVGGPQNRVGSHRSYVQWARSFAAAGHRVLRFDYEGQGDSEGDYLGYGLAGPSIRAALAFCHSRIAGLTHPLLFALCDGAAASLIYAGDHRDDLAGLLLLNPYTHSSGARARTMLRHYYVSRLKDPAFWRKLLALRLDWGDAFGSLARTLRQVLGLPVKLSSSSSNASASEKDKPVRPVNSIMTNAPTYAGFDEEKIPEKVKTGLLKWRKPLVALLCEPDLTAQDFHGFSQGLPEVKTQMREGRYRLQWIPEADHTFSSSAWKRTATTAALAGLESLLHSARKE